MTDHQWRLDTLPSDVLLLIFDYCHAFDLVRLSEVCKRFNDIVQDDVLWFERRKQPLATNQTSKRFRQRCNTLLCLRARWHVSQNWKSGKFEINFLHSWRIKAMPWICLTNDILWWSGGNRLCAFRRKCQKYSKSRESFVEADEVFNRDNISSDISKFVVRDNWIISGHADGSIVFWSRSESRRGYSDFKIDNAHLNNVNAVDEFSGTIFSGATDGTVKLWSEPCEGVASSVPRATIDVLDRIWSLASDLEGTRIAVGSSGHNAIPPLKIFDIECLSESIVMRHRWRRGAGILDMVWEDANILLTCGYDTCIRKWDTRIGTCVASWTDPTDAALYSISSDHCYTIVTGTQYHCKAVLWDQRMTNYMQLYFLTTTGRISSPVYSIAFDSSNLYGATDRRLVELKYSGYRYSQKDYRNIFRSEWSIPIAKNAISKDR